MSAPVAGLHLDLGRITVTEMAAVRSISFWLRLTEINENRLIWNAFKLQKEWVTNTVDCWAFQVKSYLDRLGLSYAWDSPPPLKAHSRFLNMVKQRIVDQSFSRHLSEASKLSTLKNYVDVKTNFGLEEYMKLSLNERRAAAILRLNCTRSLPVVFEIDSKTCKACSSKLTDVWCHLLYFCSSIKGEPLPLRPSNIMNHVTHTRRTDILRKYIRRVTAILSHTVQ